MFPRSFAAAALLSLVACGAATPPDVAAARASSELTRVVARVSRWNDDPAAAEPLGSGVVLDPKGYVLTAVHVVGTPALEEIRTGKAPLLEVAFIEAPSGGDVVRYRAQIVALDMPLDLALLRITADARGHTIDHTFPAVSLRDADEPLGPGEPLLAAGYPGAFETMQLAAGILSGISPNADGAIAWLRSDMQLLPGMSGGGVFDGEGRLVGTPLEVRQSTWPISLSRPIGRLPRAWIDGMESDGFAPGAAREQLVVSADHPIAGVALGDTNTPALDGTAEIFFVAVSPGAGVLKVEPSSAEATVVDWTGAPVRSGIEEVEILPDEDPRVWIQVRVPRKARERQPWRATFVPGAQAKLALPRAQLRVVVKKSGVRGDAGQLLVAPRDAPAFESLADLAAGRTTAADLQARGMTTFKYEVDKPIEAGDFVCGRTYAVAVLPDTGTGLTTTVAIRGQASQTAEIGW